MLNVAAKVKFIDCFVFLYPSARTVDKTDQDERWCDQWFYCVLRLSILWFVKTNIDFKIICLLMIFTSFAFFIFDIISTQINFLLWLFSTFLLAKHVAFYIFLSNLSLPYLLMTWFFVYWCYIRLSHYGCGGSTPWYLWHFFLTFVL